MAHHTGPHTSNHYWIECPCLQSGGEKSKNMAEIVQLSGIYFLLLIGAKTPPNSIQI